MLLHQAWAVSSDVRMVPFNQLSKNMVKSNNIWLLSASSMGHVKSVLEELTARVLQQ